MGLHFQVFRLPWEWDVNLELQCEELPGCFAMLLCCLPFPPAMCEKSATLLTSDASPACLRFPTWEGAGARMPLPAFSGPLPESQLRAVTSPANSNGLAHTLGPLADWSSLPRRP